VQVEVSTLLDKIDLMVENYDMAMNIKSTTAHDLAKELAAIEHTSVTQAVTLSLREALDRRRSQEIADQRLAKIRGIADRFTDRVQASPGPSLWEVNEELYDENGVPR